MEVEAHLEPERVARAEAAWGDAGAEKGPPDLRGPVGGEDDLDAVLAGVARPADEAVNSGDLELRGVHPRRQLGGGERGDGGASLRPLDREHPVRRCEVLDLDVEARRELTEAGEIGLVVGGVGDREVGAVLEQVGEEVVEDAAVVGAEAGVLGAPGSQLGDVVGDRALEEGERVGAGGLDLAHVGDVEHAGALAHGLVLGGDALVLDGHLPAGEGDQLGAGRDVLVEQRRAPQVSPVSCLGLHPEEASGSSRLNGMRLVHESAEPVGAALGAPWARPLAGTLDRLVVESDLLAGNPLGDSARRPLWVLRPPGVDLDHPRPLPVIYVIQGFTGQLDSWGNRSFFEPTYIERMDAMLASEECPDALVVMVDCWTAYGGSQFLDSIGTGMYQSYLCDEIVPFVDERYPTIASRDGRGLAGKSSGGYGAMVVPMMRPDVFSALASHAGDALFELTLPPGMAQATRVLRDNFDSSWDVFFEALNAGPDPFDFGRFGVPLEMYAYGAAYSPDPERPGRALLPFRPDGGLVPEVWEVWLAHDPVRMAAEHADALRSMRRIYLDAGRSDEYFLDLGAQAFSRELAQLGVDHTLELFEGRHGGITWRYPLAVKELAVALSA